jgi:hypothetical protein
MRDIFDDDRLCHRFFEIIEEADDRLTCYVYRVKDGDPVRPALLKCSPYPALFDDLRDLHGGGEFQVMVRRGETMLIAGLLRIAEPIARLGQRRGI